MAVELAFGHDRRDLRTMRGARRSLTRCLQMSLDDRPSFQHLRRSLNERLRLRRGALRRQVNSLVRTTPVTLFLPVPVIPACARNPSTTNSAIPIASRSRSLVDIFWGQSMGHRDGASDWPRLKDAPHTSMGARPGSTRHRRERRWPQHRHAFRVAQLPLGIPTGPPCAW